MRAGSISLIIDSQIPPVDGMVSGEDLVLAELREPKAVVTNPDRQGWLCPPGTAKGTKHGLATDFDLSLLTLRSQWHEIASQQAQTKACGTIKERKKSIWREKKHVHHHYS